MNPIETVWLAHLPHHRNCSCWADGFGSVEKGLGDDRRSYPKIQVAMTTSCSPSPQKGTDRGFPGQSGYLDLLESVNSRFSDSTSINKERLGKTLDFTFGSLTLHAYVCLPIHSSECL